MVFIDSDFCCYVTNNGTMSEIHTDFFDGKCQAFIEGYRFIPHGSSWTDENGVSFKGETVFPWKPYDELDQAQREYERHQLVEAQTALEIILGEVDA